MLKPEDLKNPKNASGYNYVRAAGGMQRPPLPAYGKPWCATLECDSKGGRKRGPRRSLPIEAAQDYCDYVNGISAAYGVQLKQANHPKPEKKAPVSERQQKLRAEINELERLARQEALKAGETGFVYLVAEEGNSTAFKVGKTWLNPPEARLRSLQTGNPRKLIMVASKPGSVDGCDKDEKVLHARYISYNDYYGEWFSPCAELMAEFGLKYPFIVGEEAPQKDPE